MAGGGKVAGAVHLGHHLVNLLRRRAAQAAHGCSLETAMPRTSRILLNSIDRVRGPRMSPRQTDRHHFDRQIAYAPPGFILLSLLAVLERRPSTELRRSVSFLIAYLIVALLVAQLQRLLPQRRLHLPRV